MPDGSLLYDEIRPHRDVGTAVWQHRRAGRVALHCAQVTIRRPPAKASRRLVPRPYLWALAVPLVTLAAILFAGSVAKALRWATL